MNTDLYRIVRFTATELNVRVEDLLSDRRPTRVVRARQLAMWITRKATDLSMPEIGREFGGRDHSTVFHALRRTEERRKNKVFREISDDLLARFKDMQARADAMRKVA